jgi:large subunit ribosomal protein L23
VADLDVHYRVIKKSLFTEKGSFQQERTNTFAFRVARDANKVQIRRAVEAIFNVHVEKVRTMRVPGKTKRVGWSYGQLPDWKKALVTLRQGETIHKV